ncbi:TetR/AcrR family transcriptional regulator [Gordonibacter urolithinfaciens]|uniref:TetR/AcrR family transcriptional regulator n=1 Tax=Gordonibacter urolithinfaciens TaxID=1335613 RepID=UPI0034A8CD4F
MKQDHRIRLTKLLLREAFLNLLVEKPVAKITVKELCEQANVNRATFYAHYRDLFDLHEEIERELAHTIMRSLSTTLPDQSLSAFSNEICRIIVDNERSCQAIFGEHGDPEFPLRVVETLRESSIALWRRQRPDLPEAELDRLYTFMANGCLSVIRSWVRNDMADSPQDIARFIEKMTDSGLAAL